MQTTVHHKLLDAVRDYKMPTAAAELLTGHESLILGGVTAAGKDTILEYIVSTTQWRHVVTHTTRKPRAGEQNGQNYWFVSQEDMLKLLETQAMIETKAVHGTTVYGTSIAAYQAVIDQGHKPLLRIDIQGILELTNQLPGLKAAFILPPSFEVWMERLENRGRMSHIEKIQRLRSAQMELKEALNSRHFMFVVNREFKVTADEILRGVSDGLTQHRNRELAEQLIDHVAHF